MTVENHLIKFTIYSKWEVEQILWWTAVFGIDCFFGKGILLAFDLTKPPKDIL